MRRKLIVTTGQTVAGMSFLIAVILAKLEVNIMWVYAFGLLTVVGFGVAMNMRTNIINERIEKQKVKRSSEMVLNDLNDN